MLCTTAAEMELIKMTDAGRYADPATLCSATCRQILAWYDWEMATAKATYELLRNLENVLRCAVSGRLASHYGREDWWHAPRLRLTHSTMEKIETAEIKLRHDEVPVTPTAILCKVPLGFWVTLLGRGHDYETQIWRPVSSGFPGYRGLRGQLHSRLDHLRSLRNEVAHQEPIKDHDLAADRRSILTAIGYVSEAVARRVDKADTALPQLLVSRPGICAQRGGGSA